MYGIMFYKSPIGKIAAEQQGEAITRIYLPPALPDGKPEIKMPLLKEVCRQLDEYFSGALREFNLPLGLNGTDFQNKVWHALCRIPYGTTASYKQVSLMAGNEKACRAVGMANNKNPIPIIIPCHRVIGADGGLVGYGGGIEIKKRLLELEGVRVSSKYKVLSDD